jgi:hypothetical protein
MFYIRQSDCNECDQSFIGKVESLWLPMAGQELAASRDGSRVCDTSKRCVPGQALFVPDIGVGFGDFRSSVLQHFVWTTILLHS